MLVEVFFSDLLKRGKLINASVVDEDVKLPERFLGFAEQTLNVSLLRDICLNRDGLASVAGNFGDTLVYTGFTGGVVDDHSRAFSRQVLGDRSAYTLGCPRDDSDFTAEFFLFAHRSRSLFCFVLFDCNQTGTKDDKV